jgi:hypothetical protein
MRISWHREREKEGTRCPKDRTETTNSNILKTKVGIQIKGKKKFSREKENITNKMHFVFLNMLGFLPLSIYHFL